MVSHAIAKFLPSLRLRLGTKAVICAVLLIVVNTALVIGAAYWSLTSELRRPGLARHRGQSAHA